MIGDDRRHAGQHVMRRQVRRVLRVLRLRHGRAPATPRMRQPQQQSDLMFLLLGL